ncbi:glycosyltransferase family 4 protein [Klenkia terrae]|uniref:glycosyltransferase family 4 protein n=1 Tax=Klenkia terrae TaxID=1052259 RepID=UPI003620A9E2
MGAGPVRRCAGRDGTGRGLLTRATAWLEIALLKRADSISVIHEVFRRRLVEAGIAPNRIEVIPNWSHVYVPEDVDVPAVRARLGWGPDEVIALHAGNIGVKQGLDGLVDVARLADQRGSRVRVVVMGDGSQRAHVMALGADVDRLTFLAPLPDGEFETALAAADVLVLHEKPGLVEMSVPSKLTSYFTAGRPVVAATDPRSGASSLMAAAGAGRSTSAGDAAAILDSIEQVAADPAASTAMGARGRVYAAEHLTSAASLRRYTCWVHQLAGDGQLVPQPVGVTSPLDRELSASLLDVPGPAPALPRVALPDTAPSNAAMSSRQRSRALAGSAPNPRYQSAVLPSVSPSRQVGVQDSARAASSTSSRSTPAS